MENFPSNNFFPVSNLFVDEPDLFSSYVKLGDTCGDGSGDTDPIGTDATETDREVEKIVQVATGEGMWKDSI